MPKTWKMWAHDEGDGFSHIGEKWWVEIHYLDEPVVPVVVTESEDGTYWGWLENEREKKYPWKYLGEKEYPSMIQGHYDMLVVCFGAESAIQSCVEKGEGRVVQLDIRLGDHTSE
jgi:hypothetical protein